jgi:DNA-binding transcriptional MerR regulator
MMQGPKINRLYYSTKDISQIFKVPIHLIRDLEKNYSGLRPAKGKTGRIMYRPKDLEIIRRIMKLRRLGYTDEDIKSVLKDRTILSAEECTVEVKIPESLIMEMIQGLNEILMILEMRNSQ